MRLPSELYTAINQGNFNKIYIHRTKNKEFQLNNEKESFLNFIMSSVTF